MRLNHSRTSLDRNRWQLSRVNNSLMSRSKLSLDGMRMAYFTPRFSSAS
ncbi:MAG: hypothetical protein WBL65_02590 [Bryobacteraceae bacterium]